MPIRNTVFANEHLYHIFNRGINHIPIFSQNKDYQRFKELMDYCHYADYPFKFSYFKSLPCEERTKIKRDLKERFVNFIAYCLMPNHFHFVLRQKKEKGITSFINRLLTSYTKYFNLKYKRTGPLFDGRFKAVLIETDEQLMHLVRYIHLNPFSSFLIKEKSGLFSYQWSSFVEYLNPNKEDFCEEKQLILSLFKNNQENFKKFTLDQADYQRNLEIIKHLVIDRVN